MEIGLVKRKITALGLCCQPVNSVINFLAKTGQHEAIVILRN